MQTEPATQHPRIPYFTGLILLLISAFIFSLPFFTTTNENGNSGLFMFNYIITAAYMIVLLIAGTLKKGRGGVHCLFIFLVLFLISAFSLNRDMNVFEESADWMGCLLVISCAVYLTFPYLSRLPLAAQQIIMALTGLALLLWIYLSIYLLPMYPLGAIAAVLLGISLHTFVPLLLTLFTIRWLKGALQRDKRLRLGLGSGVLFAIVVITVFCVQWNTLDRITAKQYQHSLLDENTDLPSWIKVSRHLPDNWATERYLKGKLVYSTPSNFDGIGLWSMPSRGLNEARKHDPLVMIASMFSGASSLNEQDRIKVLESKYDARHKTEERLWSGANLRTTGIITNANIWPAMHLAYTEQTITVANHSNSQRWRNQEEAIYTFHLPEGSAVTSLSLWIDGKESKGILTTKGKADSAYKAIVGVERRDPSLVHWAEGNRVAVRVFPVVAGDHRVFKIGVTTPLVQKNGRLIYQPMKFEGPVTQGALATTQLRIDGALANPKGLSGFDKDEKGRYKWEGSYYENWQLAFDAPELKESAFSFDGNTYALQAYSPQRVPSLTNRIYLDLNSAWTRSEFNAVFELAKDKKLYACTDEIIKLTEENKDAVFKAIHKTDFSLFPLFGMKDTETALLITKSPERSPNVKDLAGSGFAAKLEEGLKNGNKIKLFNLGGDLSPYLKTLKEHRAFRYEHGDLKDLKGLLERSQFAADAETESSIVIDDAGMRITKTAGPTEATGTPAATGPDHLMRLFAYNHVIQHLGKNLYTNMEGDSALMKEASEAYVVSPISSLVVLESAMDYDRFSIKHNPISPSLQNASVSSSGAVPEPHEWALIILAFSVLVWLQFRRRFQLLKVRR